MSKPNKQLFVYIISLHNNNNKNGPLIGLQTKQCFWWKIKV